MKNVILSLSRLLLSALLLLVSVWTQTSRAETIDCTAITSLPYIIATQGIYCLTGNLSTNISSGNAIEIQTNNVTLDLNGYKLGGLGAGNDTQAIGIYAWKRKNITIKNGIVRGFYQGIYLRDAAPYTASAGHTVKTILADQNTLAGIWAMGLGNTISTNNVVDTGGSTRSNYAYGIVIYGSGAKVVNNTVSTTTAQSTGLATGIFLQVADYSLAQNNTVTDTFEDISGISYAIRLINSSGVFLRGNNLANSDYGLYFAPISAGSTGKYFNNLTFDVTTPFSGGTAVGGNNN